MMTVMRPQPGPVRPYEFPAFTRRTLSNGMQFVFARVSRLPLATVLLVTDAGAMCDPSEREGVAVLTARLLLEGTGSSDGSAVMERFERLGASIDADADWDAAVVRMTLLSERLREALPLFAELVSFPSFPGREIERLKGERIAELLQQRAEPRGLANDMFEKFLYDEHSRFSRPERGGEESVAAISRDDIARFHEQRYQPRNMALIVAGDVTPEDVEPVLDVISLRSEKRPDEAPVVSEEPARRTRAVHLVAKEDAPQSELRIGHVGLRRSHPDYFSVTIMNALLGGLFSSRINLNLREVHGYTYGASSSFDWRLAAGPFSVSTAVKSDVTDAAIREILLEIDRMRGETVSPGELSLATSYLDGVFPIRYETTSAIASALARLVIHDLSDDYFGTYREQIRSVSRDDVLDVAQRHLHPDRLQIVVVGDSTVVLEPLERSGLGPTTLYDAEGKRKHS